MLRIPAGTRDLCGDAVRIRDGIIHVAQQYMRAANGVELDTPIFELASTVHNIYGPEFNKLVYRLNTDGDDMILRYDLTVPFARYVGMTNQKIFRRYHAGKVYRSDDPEPNRARFREFRQCDFDIAGADPTGMYDVEILDLTNTILLRLLGDTFTIQINDRAIITDYLSRLRIKTDPTVICQIFDKLDKNGLEAIKAELMDKVDESKELVEFLDQVIALPPDPVCRLTAMRDQGLIGDAYDTMYRLCVRLNALNIRYTFNPLLARGLDYYTGVIFEATYDNVNIISTSIGGGGRYDNLIEKFSSHGKIPSIGMSIGVERIALIYDLDPAQQDRRDALLPVIKRVYVGSLGQDMLVHRLKVTSELRSRGVVCVLPTQENPKMKAMLGDVRKSNIGLMVMLAEDELRLDLIQIKLITDDPANNTKFNLPYAEALDYITKYAT